MSLRISDFYTPDAQNFVFRNACFSILVDLAAHRCLKRYAQAPIFSTLAGLVTCYAIAQSSPLPLQLLSGGIFLAYKATSYALSYLAPSPKPKLSWDDVKILASLRTILPLIESQTNKEYLYQASGKHESINSFKSDPGNYTMAEIVQTDVETLTGFVKGLLQKMNPPLLGEAHPLFEKASKLSDGEKSEGYKAAYQTLSPYRREILQMLILHLHKISSVTSTVQSTPNILGPLFSQNLAGNASLGPALADLIQNPAILK